MVCTPHSTKCEYSKLIGFFLQQHHLHGYARLHNRESTLMRKGFVSKHSLMHVSKKSL